MTQLIDRVLKPNKSIFVIYCFLSFIGLIVYVWIFSFSWFFDVNHFLVAMLVFLLVGLLIALFLDRKFNYGLKNYFWVSIVQLLLIWLVSSPIRNWQVESSLKKAELITKPLEFYKRQNGRYPNTLMELEKQLNIDIPLRTNIGTRFRYEVNSDNDYRLEFLSYYGYTTQYSIDDNEWFNYD